MLFVKDGGTSATAPGNPCSHGPERLHNTTTTLCYIWRLAGGKTKLYTAVCLTEEEKRRESCIRVVYFFLFISVGELQYLCQ